jgi:hypothetical protein
MIFPFAQKINIDTRERIALEGPLYQIDLNPALDASPPLSFISLSDLQSPGSTSGEKKKSHYVSAGSIRVTARSFAERFLKILRTSPRKSRRRMVKGKTHENEKDKFIEMFN